MTYPEGNGVTNYGSSRDRSDQGYTLRQTFEDGGIKAGAARAASLAYKALSRRKAAEEGVARLARVLSALDLTALGIGSTLGVGVYVLAGNVAKNYAGPAVILSFLLAAVASVLAGLCYAEFGARVPKAGSAYVYSYVCVGEFIAFVIGWNLILEYIIGAASVVKGLSEYLDALLNKTMSTYMEALMPLDTPHLARYPDLFAFFVIIAFSAALACGFKESTKFNNFCTGVNLCVVLFVTISGCFKANPANWRIPASAVPEGKGSGGFAPFGLAGIIRGAAKCFYGFIGFDCVATAGEEAKRPQKTIPFAVVTSLFVIFLAYSGVSCVLTLMLPYYEQDVKAPFPYVYDRLGWTWAKYAVNVGAICALCSSLLGAVFPLPRIIYAMASDGLLFKFMGRVSDRFQTPLIGTMIAGLFTGTLAMLLELDDLIDMMSIGTLLAYSMVASCVSMLRYERSVTAQRAPEPLDLSLRSVLRQAVNADKHLTPTRLSSAIVTALVTLYGVWCFIMISSIHFYGEEILAGKAGPTAMLVLGVVLVVSTLYGISRQPVSEKKLAFTVPLVPWLPGVSILINIYLMMTIGHVTWIQFGVWLTIGLIIYITYGAWHSSERRRTLDGMQLADLHNDSQTALLHQGAAHTLG